jgi:hypothetical protein
MSARTIGFEDVISVLKASGTAKSLALNEGI